MTSPVSAIEAIEKAMEGVTVEEWIVNGDRFSVETDATFIPDQKVIALCATGDGAMARALYIAACSPVAMREVLALARQAEALTGIGSAHDLISDWLGEGTDDLPDETPVRVEIGKRTIISDNLGSLRRARALLGGSENAGN
jgi:hypothetical protein